MEGLIRERTKADAATDKPKENCTAAVQVSEKTVVNREPINKRKPRKKLPVDESAESGEESQPILKQLRLDGKKAAATVVLSMRERESSSCASDNTGPSTFYEPMVTSQQIDPIRAEDKQISKGSDIEPSFQAPPHHTFQSPPHHMFQSPPHHTFQSPPHRTFAPAFQSPEHTSYLPYQSPHTSFQTPQPQQTLPEDPHPHAWYSQSAPLRPIATYTSSHVPNNISDTLSAAHTSLFGDDPPSPTPFDIQRELTEIREELAQKDARIVALERDVQHLKKQIKVSKDSKAATAEDVHPKDVFPTGKTKVDVDVRLMRCANLTSAVKTLMVYLFTHEELVLSSITGQKSNKARHQRPRLDADRVGYLTVLLMNHFRVTQSDVQDKIRSRLKIYRQQHDAMDSVENLPPLMNPM